MLIVPHALRCVDGCFFCILPLLTVWLTVLVSVFPPPPPPPPSNPHFFSFQIWILCQNLLARELKIRVVGFVLKKSFTHFEMLIVSHAFLTVCYTVLVSVLDNLVSVEQLMSKET